MNLFKIFSAFKSKNTRQKIDRQPNKNDRSKTLFIIFTLCLLTITTVNCWQVINNPQSDPDAVKSAFILNTTIVSGLIGFVTGKAI